MESNSVDEFQKGEAWAEECFHAGMGLDEIELIVANGESYDKTEFDAGARSMIRELEGK